MREFTVISSRKSKRNKPFSRLRHFNSPLCDFHQFKNITGFPFLTSLVSTWIKGFPFASSALSPRVTTQNCWLVSGSNGDY